SEQTTSGEIRVFAESRCSYVDALDRAKEIFFSLKMNQTGEKNAVLIYVAVKDKQMAIYADEGIYSRVNKDWWFQEVEKMASEIRNHDLTTALCDIILDLGQLLKEHYPYQVSCDKNELPDEIVFGK
ncbi:MAG: TPM domain-containing protein, partial [Chitinophagaceae bacterium]|nr:TPM domain-containing protein [Chitinophagaceae bacterium]